MRAVMLDGESHRFQLPGDQLAERASRERVEWSTHCQEKFPRRRPGSYLLQVANNGFSHSLAKRKRLASKQLGTREDYLFPLPLNVVELQAGHLSGANAVHREQQQDRVVTDSRRLVPGGGMQKLLHVVPRRPGRKRLMLEHAGRHDRGCDTGLAPSTHCGVSKE